MTLATEPRLRADLAPILNTFNLIAPHGEPEVWRTDDVETQLAFVRGWDAHAEAFYHDLVLDAHDGESVTVDYETLTIKGVDDNDIRLFVHRPAVTDTTVPCVVYMHGGGMTLLTTDNGLHMQWCHDLAATGVVVIAVDFRNAVTATGVNPFPAGLNDCLSGVQWIWANREQLGIDRIVVQGESGGGNLVLATALAAKRAGTIDQIAGVYSMVPQISGAYGWERSRLVAELPSLVECDGYFLSRAEVDILAAVYESSPEDAENPLCWPYHASPDDLNGLPPHVISVNELDPLRDEGLAYYRKLSRAGVIALGRVNVGLIHGVEALFRRSLPDVYWSTVADIADFARRCR